MPRAVVAAARRLSSSSAPTAATAPAAASHAAGEPGGQADDRPGARCLRRLQRLERRRRPAPEGTATRCIAFSNPLRGRSRDGEYLRQFLTTISGPVVLVGHSYGGAVITNAATGNPNVKSLVYVAAYAPDRG